MQTDSPFVYPLGSRNYYLTGRRANIITIAQAATAARLGPRPTVPPSWSRSRPRCAADFMDDLAPLRAIKAFDKIAMDCALAMMEEVGI